MQIHISHFLNEYILNAKKLFPGDHKIKPLINAEQNKPTQMKTETASYQQTISQYSSYNSYSPPYTYSYVNHRYNSLLASLFKAGQ